MKTGRMGLVAPTLIAITLMAIVCVGCGDPVADTESAVKQAVQIYEVYEGVTKVLGGPPTITLSQFDGFQDGMTYEQAVGIVGADADIIVDDSIGPTGAIRRVAQWLNADGSRATATFINVRLVTKDQTGLE